MKSLSHKYIVLTSLLCFVGYLTSCANHASETKEETEEHDHGHEEGAEIEISEKQLATVGIQLGHIEMKPIGSGLTVNGELAVSADQTADVSPMHTGKVISIVVKEGETVSAGRVLATIETFDMIPVEQSFIAAKSQVKLCEQEYARQKALAEHGAGIAKNLQRADIDLQTARAEMESLASQLRMSGISPASVSPGNLQNRITVKAPISGVVNKIYGKVGSVADLSTPLMQITNNNALFALLRVYEKDLKGVKTGQRVEMSLTNGEGLLQGVVQSVNHTLDPETKVVDVKVSITGGDRKSLLPGMALNAVISSQEVMSRVLPEDAVVSKGDRSFIYMVEGEETEGSVKMYHLVPVEVVTGTVQNGYVEINPVKELPEDATVVTSKAFYISSMASDHGEHNH